MMPFTARSRFALLCVSIGFTATGCSDQPRAIQEAKPIQATQVEKPLELPTGDPPAKSDPEAEALVLAAVKAHTNGKPELLEKLRRFKLVRDGLLGGTQSQVWEFRAEWPNRFRVDDTQLQMTIVRDGQAGWMAIRAQGGKKTDLPDTLKKGVMADTVYEFLLALVPLGDRSLVAAKFPDRTVNGKPASGVWLSGANLPRAVVFFDQENKRMVQCAYQGFEPDVPITKEVTIRDYREVNGVQIPSIYTIRWDGRPAVEWSLTNIEFPAEFPAKLFEEP